MTAQLKTLLLALCVTASPVTFAQCAALDYQEMKEMSAEELTREYCNYHREAAKAVDASISSYLHNSKAASQNEQNVSEQCWGQRDRIGRVLKQKGIEPSKELWAKCRAGTELDKDTQPAQ